MKYNLQNFIQLQDNTVHLWCFNFEVDDNQFQIFYGLLSEDEKERAERFRFYKDKRCFVVTRGTLRLLSSKYLNKNTEDIVFDYEEFGKPKYRHQTRLNFNVSHSGNRAVIAFNYDKALGVDIEKIKHNFDTFEIASNYFSKDEIKALQNLPEPEHNNGFYRCWTRKEAFIKAIGSGLSFPLDTFSVSLGKDDEAELLETKWDKKDKNNWCFYTFKPSQDYIGAVIVNQSNSYFEYFDLDPNMLL